MSISPADITSTTLPSAVAPVPSAGNTDITVLIHFAITLVWTVAAIFAAKYLRAFRRQSIVGPTRTYSAQEALNLATVLIVSYLFVPLIALRISRSIAAPEDLKMIAINAGLYVVIIFSILFALVIIQPVSLHRLGLNYQWIGSGFIGGAATLFIVYPIVQLTEYAVELALHFLHAAEPAPHEMLQFLENHHSRFWQAVAVMSVVAIAPMAEELLFRGLLQTVLGRFFAWILTRCTMPIEPLSIASPAQETALIDASSTSTNVSVEVSASARWIAVVVTAALFATVHNSVPFFMPLFVLAVALGYVYERTGNLWVNIFTHALFNTGQILYFSLSR